MNYLHHFFESTASLNPDNPAVSDSGNETTYAALNQQANRIARALIESGCRANDRILVYTPKSINTYAGVLGALKANGCFVPMAADAPLKRVIDQWDEIIPVAIIVDQTTLATALEARESINAKTVIILVDDNSDQENVLGLSDIDRFNSENIEISNRSPEDLAYIIYTSGSTGRPKGVMVLHRNISFFLNSCKKMFPWEPGLRFAHHSELTFDPSIFDLFYCWATAGVLVPMNKRRYRIDPASFLVEEKINVWFCVPSAIQQIEKSGRLGDPDLKTLHHLILTGEATPPLLVNLWRKTYPDCQIYNFYGATEAAIITHWLHIQEDLNPKQVSPVGKLVPGMKAILVDGNELMPPGEKGECVIYGPQVSPGYWRNPAETSLRFVNNLLSSDLPQKMYRMGDTLRKRDDDSYEFWGRQDRQVKVQGHRVELQELETIVMLHPGINETAVEFLPIPGKKQKCLVCFIASNDSISENEIRAFLAKSVPPYMMPFAIIQMDSLPKNSNKKIDRLALGHIFSEHTI